MTDLIPGVAEAKIAATVLKYLPIIAGVAVVFGAGVVFDRKAPFFGADATIARLTTARDGFQAAFKSEQASFRIEQGIARASEAARRADHKGAVVDANATSKTCEARIVKARATTTAIDALLNKAPTHAPDPVEPELLTAGELRIATGR